MIASEQIRQFASEIAQRYGPEKIILFGSQSLGKATNDSDVDLLVIMDFPGSSARMAGTIRSQIDHSFPLDLLVRSPADVAWRISQNDSFLREIVSSGTVLYDAAR